MPEVQERIASSQVEEALTEFLDFPPNKITICSKISGRILG